ncbi:hypothetical protein [Deinococcus fonticola]|uniref:hypothetical protein n=1 Tax=Deinococcus fonticola TaxID=2528713 RepID=UPI0014303453|nr:hypothetical protein [Deinococcus fonticola]
MARKKTKKPATPEKPTIRSTLHQVLAGRKNAAHRPAHEKRAAQKLRRELEDQ